MTAQAVTKELALSYLKTLEAYNTDEGYRLTDIEIDKFIQMAVRNNLDPYKRELHLVKSKKAWKGSYNFKLVTGYDVYLRRADASGCYEGYESSFEEVKLLGKTDVVCSILFRRKGWEHPLIHKTFFREHAPSNNRQWDNMPHYMHEKVTLSQGLRRAFPVACGGLPYTDEEMSGVGEAPPETKAAVKPKPDARSKALLKLTRAMDKYQVTKDNMLAYVKETYGVASAAELETAQILACAEWASTPPKMKTKDSNFSTETIVNSIKENPKPNAVEPAPALEPEPEAPAPEAPAPAGTAPKVSIDTLNALGDAMKVNGIFITALRMQMEAAFGKGNTNPRVRTEDEVMDLISWCDEMGADNDEATDDQ